MPTYWFRPKRFWNWFAAYYPVSWQGWLVFALALVPLIYGFRSADRYSHSASDTLINFTPWFLGTALVLDFITRRKGEFPSWWRRKWWPHK